jgi:hypothetical protein
MGGLVMSHASNCAFGFCALLLVTPIITFPNIGGASPIDIPTLTQGMIADQAEETLLLGVDFGADSSSPISFFSIIDPLAMSYTFATQPGSTYLGQALVINGSGVFDPATNIMNVSSFVRLGSASFTSSGTDVIDLTTVPKKDTVDKKYTPNRKTNGGIEYNDSHYEDLKFSDGRSMFTGFSTLDGKKIDNTEIIDLDEYSRTGAWGASMHMDSEAITVSSFGFSPLAGGAGTFTTTVAVPAPVIGQGVPGVVAVGGAFLFWWRRRQKTA